MARSLTEVQGQVLKYTNPDKREISRDKCLEGLAALAI